jgi:predicted Kef-type K+ transport protein
MNDLLLLIGRVAGIGGALLCAVAAVLRVSGLYWFAGFQIGTLLLMGTAVMVVGCVSFLAVLTERSKIGS